MVFVMSAIADNEAQSACTSEGQYYTYLLLNNPKPNNNLGPLLRCASAFSISQVMMIGYLKCNTEGAHGANKHLLMTSTTTWDHAFRDLRNCYNDEIQVVGIVRYIHSFDEVVLTVESKNCGQENKVYKSFPVHTRPFSDSAVAYCFLLIDRNEESLNISLLEQCDLLLHVPQVSCSNLSMQVSSHADDKLTLPPTTGVRSLVETPACFSIVMHHFCAWIGRQQRTVHGHKFDVAQHLTGCITENEQLKLKSARLEARKKNEENAEGLFDGDGGDNESSWGFSIFGES